MDVSTETVQIQWMNDVVRPHVLFLHCYARTLGEYHYLTQAGRRANACMGSCFLGFLQKRDAWAGTQLDTLRIWACSFVALFLYSKAESCLEWTLGSSCWQPELRCQLFKGEF